MKPNRTMEQFSHAATIMPTLNMEDSLKFYADHLGFEITFKWLDPVAYAVLKKGSVSIHLSLQDGAQKHNPTSIYIFVYDVDHVFEELINSGLEGLKPPEKQDYGMIDFDVIDPYGNQITFGKGN